MDSITLTVIRLANEIRDLAADCENVEAVPVEVKMRLEFLSGYAAAIRSLQEYREYLEEE
jgi:hypothetical protein